jgi:hypothetical protein
MEPTTVLAIALSVGAAAIASGPTNAALADAYTALKVCIQKRYGVDLESLERHPASIAERQALAETLSSRLEHSQSELTLLLGLARSIFECASSIDIKRVGINHDNLEAANVAILTVASSGTGVQVVGQSIGGNITIGGKSIGIEPVDPWPQPGKRSK